MSLPAPQSQTHVLITGASSGIGAQIARDIAALGHDLTLVARRRERLEELAGELRDAHGVTVDVRPCDLGDAAARRTLVTELTTGARTVVGLVNCAGFGTAANFLDLDRERELQQIEVNVSALLELTHAFAQPMVDHGAGAILNVASIAAFQPLPRMATYGATKAFVQSFSEAVHEELRGTGVSCTVLCPGPVRTEWSEIAGADAVMFGPAIVSVADVAADGVNGMVKGKRSVVPGLAPKLASTAGRYAPRTVLLPLVNRVTGR